MKSNYRVLPIVLDTGEVLPTLVRRRDWIPARVATRWAVRRRRFECMPSTLAHDLRALAVLYDWADGTLRCDLDDRLECFEVPTGSQLDSLIAFIRTKGGTSDLTSECIKGMATLANQAAAIRSFLVWSVDPANQGSRRRKPHELLVEEQSMLTEVFRRLIRNAGSPDRIPPVSDPGIARINEVFGPCREDGRLILPLSFDSKNPFRPPSRLRNWLMYTIAHQCGLRRGELLKLRLDDLPKPDEPGLNIRRRPHDAADGRRYKPSVKTVERVLPLSGDVRAGLRAYLSSPPPFGRPAGRSPFLFVSATGQALSIRAADKIVKLIGAHAEVPDLSWHSFRHAWAESLADDLLNDKPEDQALALIRQVGGWRSTTTPLHYIQNVLAKRANEFLSERNSRLYLDPEGGK
jgi:integrase